MPYQNALYRVEIGDNVRNIGGYVFANCQNLESITMPNGLTIGGTYAFYNCYSLRHIGIPRSVVAFGQHSIDNCHSLVSITIPPSFTGTLPPYAINQCNGLVNITLPDSAVIIGATQSGISKGDNGIYECRSLSRVVVPKSVTRIDSYVFGRSSGLGRIKFTRQTPPVIASSGTFNQIPTDCVIYVPSGTISAYKAATNYPSPNTYQYVEY